VQTVCTYLSRSGFRLCLCLCWCSSDSRLLAVLLRKLDWAGSTLWSEEVTTLLAGLQCLADVHVDGSLCHIAEVVVGKNVLLDRLTAEDNISISERRDEASTNLLPVLSLSCRSMLC